ncbi:MAG: hypothetical protein J6B10_06080 [Lachnospiraceae bacterium]|nr:hypothetical protein [Lachnospiraceae bacterium]
MDTILGPICDVLVVCISLANLIYLVWVRQQDKREQAVREEAEKKYIWYREIVMNHGMEMIDSFFAECERLLEQMKKENIADTITGFRREYNKISKRFPNTIKVLDRDLSSQICRKLENCEDIVTGHIDQFRQRSYISVPTTLGKLKNEHYQIIELLYQKGLNIG